MNKEDLRMPSLARWLQGNRVLIGDGSDVEVGSNQR